MPVTSSLALTERQNLPLKLNRRLFELRGWGGGGGGRGGVAYERGGDARRKSWMKALKETDLGVAQAFIDP